MQHFCASELHQSCTWQIFHANYATGLASNAKRNLWGGKGQNSHGNLFWYLLLLGVIVFTRVFELTAPSINPACKCRTFSPAYSLI